MWAVHLPASPRSPSLGLLGPDPGPPLCLVGPEAEAASHTSVHPKPVCLLGACPALSRAPVGLLFSCGDPSGPCSSLVRIPSVPAPLRPMHPFRAWALSVPRVPAVPLGPPPLSP